MYKYNYFQNATLQTGDISENFHGCCKFHFFGQTYCVFHSVFSSETSVPVSLFVLEAWVPSTTSSSPTPLTEGETHWTEQPEAFAPEQGSDWKVKGNQTSFNSVYFTHPSCSFTLFTLPLLPTVRIILLNLHIQKCWSDDDFSHLFISPGLLQCSSYLYS